MDVQSGLAAANSVVAGAESTISEVNEVQDIGTPPVEVEKKRLNKLKLKYNGAEFEEELPFEFDEDPKAVEYLTRKLQMAQLGTLKAKEVASLEQEIQSFVNDLRNNPRKVLSDPRLGVDLRKMAQELIEEEIENAQKSPEQLRREQLEAKLAEIEEERENERNEAKSREQIRMEEQAFQQYNTQISQALASSGLPKNSPYVVKKLADYMISEISSGNNVNPQEAMEVIKLEMMEDLNAMVEGMDPEMIEAMLGGGYDKVRKHRLSKVPKGKEKAALDRKSIDVGKTSAKKQEAAAPKVNFKEFFGV